MPNPTASLDTVFMRAWMRRGVLAFLMWPLAAVFGLVSALRRALYRAGWQAQQRLPVPVIVVGNIFIGGTGKTPLTIWLVQVLRQAGFHPGVVSRGYGAKGSAPTMVGVDADPAIVGDEPLLIAQRAACPLAVGRDRFAAGQALLRHAPDVDVIIADDGLQHYALARDFEIVLFDARGVGNGWLLPAGPLREPASRRRDVTVVNGEQVLPNMPPPVVRMRLVAGCAYRLSEPGQVRALQDVGAGLPQPLSIVAAAGIGNPARFFAMLKNAGLAFAEMPLPDHFDYAENPFAAVAADVILITEKDAVKCARSPALKNDPRLWVVPVEAQLDGMLLDQILEKLRGSSPA